MTTRTRDVDYVDEDRDRPILRSLPEGTRRAVGEDIARLQRGEEALQWKPLHGYGSGVIELRRGGWRVVLALAETPRTIWIVCVFPKDAKRGWKMRPEHKRLIKSSLKILRGWNDTSAGTRRH